MSANTENLYDGSVVTVVDPEGTLNEVGSGLNPFPVVAGDEEYAMDGLLEFAPPVWFVVVWVGWSGLLTTAVAKEFGVGNLAERERTILARNGVPGIVVVSYVDSVRDAEFLETSAGESDVGAGEWEQAVAMMFLVLPDGVTVLQDFGAGGDQRQ